MRAFVLSIIGAFVFALTGCVAPQVQQPLSTTAVQMNPGSFVTAIELGGGQVRVGIEPHGTHDFNKADLCRDAKIYVNDSGLRPMGRLGVELTIDGQSTGIICGAHVSNGGGSSNQVYVDQWVDSPLVEDNGTVTINPGEGVTEHPSTDPDDSGFDGEGPPSIDG